MTRDTRVLLAIFLILLACLIGVAMFCSSRQSRKESGTRLLNLVRLSSHLRTGMSKRQVADLLGSPDCAQEGPVWVWVASPPASRTRSLPPWQEAIKSPALFVVFDDGRLATSILKTAESNPWEAYASLPGRSLEDALRLLGPRPHVVSAP